ncbi:hypothetical protein BC831DRAFT_466071 [Entophlyctis helioformis]|nr:hypothetical protein BC831DRAFT_466071 [Entophlyctis helioformis]
MVCDRDSDDDEPVATATTTASTAETATAATAARRKPTSGRALKQGLCNKCKAVKPSVMIKSAEFCRSCFLDSVAHRFRANLSKSPLPEGSRLMLGLTGGASSRVMLNALADFVKPLPANVRKPVRFPYYRVCYVDQSAVLGNPDSLSQIRAMVDAYPGIELTVVPIESILDADSDTTTAFDPRESLIALDGSADAIAAKASLRVAGGPPADLAALADRKTALLHMLESLGKMNSKEDVLSQWTLRLLLRESRRFNCNALLIGDNATRVAIRVIANTSKGRGLSLPADIGDTPWHDGVYLLRPMRDVLAKELGIYAHLMHLNTVVHPTLTTKLPLKTSINHISEDFIMGLEKTFSATVSTVARTAFKINTDYMDKKTCPLCEGPVDEFDGFGALKLSDGIAAASSLTEASSSTTSSNCCGSGSEDAGGACCQTGQGPNTAGCCSSTPSRSAAIPAGIDLFPLLCYACRNVARDIKAEQQRQAATASNESSAGQGLRSAILPAYVGRAAAQRMSRDKMREQISDFLLDGESDDEP